HTYASKFRSDSDKHDGLYWPVAEGQMPSPLGQLGDFGNAIGSGERAFNGYCYRMFTGSGGFVIVAYPAQYRQTGIMTFATTENRVVYQRDFGVNTPQSAAALSDFHPTHGWVRVKTDEDAGKASRTR